MIKFSGQLIWRTWMDRKFTHGQRAYERVNKIVNYVYVRSDKQTTKWRPKQNFK